MFFPFYYKWGWPPLSKSEEIKTNSLGKFRKKSVNLSWGASSLDSCVEYGKFNASKHTKNKNFPVEFSLFMLHYSWLMICLWCFRLWHWWVIRWAGPAGGGRRTSKLRDRDLVQRKPHYNHEALMRGSKLMMMTIKMTIKMTILMIRMIRLVIELHQKSCQYCGFSLRDSNRDNVLLRFKW